MGTRTSVADTEAYGGGTSAAEVEAAGGMEGGGAGVADLANALADALEAGYAQQSMIDYGGVATQDVAAQGVDPSQDFQQGQQDIAGIEDFASWGQQAQPDPGLVSQDFQTATPGYQDVLGSDVGLAQATQFAGPQMTAPGQSTSPYSSDTAWKTSAQASPYGAMSELGLTGHQFAQGNPIGYAGPNSQFMSTSQNVEDQLGGGGAAAVDSFSNMPMAESFTSPTQPEGALSAGMISAGSGPYGDPAGRVAKPGAITAGTVDPAGMTGAESVLGTDAVTTTGDATGGRKFDVDDPIGYANSKASEIAQQTNTPETNTAEHKQIAQSRLDMQTTLDEKAKADPNGRVLDKFGNKTTVTNQQLANAYRGFDTTLAAYATINGQNSLVSMISNNLLGVNMANKMLGGLKQALIDRGIFNKTSAEDIVQMIQDNLASGQRPGENTIWGGGPSDEDVQGPQEIRSFIQQYPWAAELDPKYIKYLIDNPAELQDLLGQGPGGGNQAAPGNQTKPGGGGSSPPAGFTQKPGAATQALVEWTNPATGETWTAPNGSWQGPEGWIQKQYIMD